ncbi:MAG: hypothetical protein WCF20_00520 [Methylovirgula sp.]
MSKSTPYAAVLAAADLGDCGIDRIFVKHKLEEAIRFRRYWRPSLEFAEDELLILLGDAIAAGVFSRAFLAELRAVLDAQAPAEYA